MDDSTNSNTVKLAALVLFMALLTISPGCHAAVEELMSISESITGPLKPMGPMEYRVLNDVKAHVDDDDITRRRRLEPYQLCLVCKCCSATTCATMPCCFGIDCNLPGKPFGVCAFVPKTCNCTNCTTTG